jgi:Zn-dependent peptidase ImmA (M78 family)
MTLFNPERLKSARLLSGFSLREVEQRLSHRVSYNAISKYEKGKMQPDAGTVILLSQVLKVKASYFFEQSAIELGEIDFRKKSTLSQTEIEQIKIKTRDKVQRYLEAESILGISQKFINPIIRKQVKDVARVEELADIIRTEWGLGVNPIPNVIEMLEEHQVKVIEVDGPEKFDGLSTFVDDGIPVTVINENFTVERKRFTALHELGHLMMNFKVESNKEQEAACHRFAGAMLFPQSEVLKSFGERRNNISMGELVAIKEEYGISIQAAMRRLFDLNVISQPTYNFFCMRMASNKKEEGIGSFKGEERSSRLLKMAFRLFSEGVVTFERGAELAGVPTKIFNALYNNVSSEEVEENYFYKSTLNSFSKAWDEGEAEYTIDDIKFVNPDYEPR